MRRKQLRPRSLTGPGKSLRFKQNDRKQHHETFQSCVDAVARIRSHLGAAHGIGPRLFAVLETLQLPTAEGGGLSGIHSPEHFIVPSDAGAFRSAGCDTASLSRAGGAVYCAAG